MPLSNFSSPSELFDHSPVLALGGGLFFLLGPGLSIMRYLSYKLVYERSNKVKGKQFLVTGACGALGEELCLELARKGAHTLILWDVRDDCLEKTKTMLVQQYPDLRVVTNRVNLMSMEELRKTAREVMDDKSLSIDVVVNVAGIFFSGLISELTDEQEQATMQVNYHAQTEMLKLFLPYLETNGSGHIVGVASAASFNAGAAMASYCASKFALRAYYEAVACELTIKRSPVTVSLFCPGAFQSKLFQGFHLPLLPALHASSVANALLNMSIERRYAISLYPSYLSPLPVVSAMLNSLGAMLVVPINPVSNWKGLLHAKESMGR